MKTLTMLGAILRGLSYDDGKCSCVARLADPATVDAFSAADLLRVKDLSLSADGLDAAGRKQLTSQLRTAWQTHVAANRVRPAAVVVTVAGQDVAFGIGRTVDQARHPAPGSADTARRETTVTAPRGIFADRSSVVSGRVSVVTGGAQGFGEGIVRSLAEGGSTVCIADLNVAGAQRLADELNSEHGRTVALAFGGNVTDEASVEQMIDAIVESVGSVDLLVSNAGVLKAGSVVDMSLADFNFVTSVNYVGFFICTKFFAPIMALQNAASEGKMTSDIVQINSKSGLEGSNRNGAYAGSKFGSIGLVQSFAMELVADNIKVNAICPGNFFEGPLWSDPERGLFVQYLRTGKVPGAKTVEDVKRFYEGKVPMNRGCRPDDVVRAICYIVEQVYETGQAVPVTGGQVMLN